MAVFLGGVKLLPPIETITQGKNKKETTNQTYLSKYKMMKNSMN